MIYYFHMFNNEQLTKISDLLMDLAKTQLAATLLAQVVDSRADAFFAIKGAVYGLVFVSLSLKVLGLKRVV